jgi:hypothetical protein
MVERWVVEWLNFILLFKLLFEMFCIEKFSMSQSYDHELTRSVVEIYNATKSTARF